VGITRKQGRNNYAPHVIFGNTITLFIDLERYHSITVKETIYIKTTKTNIYWTLEIHHVDFRLLYWIARNSSADYFWVVEKFANAVRIFNFKRRSEIFAPPLPIDSFCGRAVCGKLKVATCFYVFVCDYFWLPSIVLAILLLESVWSFDSTWVGTGFCGVVTLVEHTLSSTVNPPLSPSVNCANG
jgi:hypothetical protein